MQISDTAIIISGGASGLGAATAIHLSSLGAKIAILDRNLELAQKIAQAAHGIAIACDVTDPGQVAHAFAQTVDKFKSIRGCISCAGVAPGKRLVGRDGPMPIEDFKKVIDINLLGTFYLMREAANHMAALSPIEGPDQQRGVIINTASIAAFEGQIGQLAYSASKGAIASMTLPAARELASFGIRVMTIAPGIFATPMLLGMSQQVQDSLGAQVPFPKRLGQGHEYAQLVQQIFENDMLNGSTIRLDGAIRLAPK